MDDPQFRTADGSAIRIWTDPVQNPFQSEKQGRPIFDEAVYVEVIAPGSKGSAPVFEVLRKFHESVGEPDYKSPQYATYEAQITAFLEKSTRTDLTGTPLAEWPEITRTMAASLRASDIFTVEALASLPDGRLKAVGPDGRTWRTKAQAWLEQTKDAGHATALAAALEQANVRENAHLARIAELEGRLAAAGDAPEAPEAPAPAPEAPAASTVQKTASAAPPAPAPAAGDTLVASTAPAPGLQPLI